MRRVAVLSLCLALPWFGGCHSHYIQTTITNTGNTDVSVVQVDYPSASFGVQSLAPGAAFHYRFKLLGSGPVKITYLDAGRREHTHTGPWLNEGQEGVLTIDVAQGGEAQFRTSLKP